MRKERESRKVALCHLCLFIVLQPSLVSKNSLPRGQLRAKPGAGGRIAGICVAGQALQMQ